MGELARRRQARDLWISHNHVRAGLVAGLLLLVGAFAAGAATQRGDAVVVEAPGWMDQAADTELVELLARVDAAAEPDGGLSRLTFPTALASDAAVPVAPPYGEPPGGTTTVALGGDADGLSGAEPLPEGWAVTIEGLGADEARSTAAALSAAGVEGVRIEERLVDGEREIRVGVGGLEGSAEAQALLLRLRQVGAPAADRARIVEIAPR